MGKRYDIIKKDRKTDNSYSSSIYPKHPKLRRGLKEGGLTRLIKPEDFFGLTIVPEKRE